MSDVDNRILGLREHAPDDWWRTELTRVLRSVREERESLQREKAETEAELKRAYADLESIRRENEVLKASRDKLEGAYLSANERLAHAKKQAEGQCDGCGEQLDDAFCTKCLNTQDAITPEMREKLERWANTIDNARAAGGPVRTAGLHQQRAGEIVDGIRDLLGERG